MALIPTATFSATTPRTTCPSGYTTITENNLVVEDTCPAGYSSAGTANSCNDTNGPCIMFAEANTEYKDASGTYVFTSDCPLDPVTKCIITEPAGCDSYSFASNWYMNCSDPETFITGVAFCSSFQDTSPDGSDAIQTTLPVSSNPNDNKYCWCKMTNPAVSKWVSSFQVFVSGYGQCAANCAEACAGHAVNDSLFRELLWSNLSD